MKRLDVISSQLSGKCAAEAYIRTEKHGSIGVIFLLQGAPYPARQGSLCLAVREAILKSLHTFQNDNDVSAILLTSDSEHVFSKGINRQNFADGIASDYPEHLRPSVGDLSAEFEQSLKPVIAAITGSCASWGVELVLGAAWRVGSEHCSFRFPEVHYHLTPCGGGVLRLLKLVGVKHGLHMLYTGARVNAVEAKKIGLLDAVLAPEVPSSGEVTKGEAEVFLQAALKATAAYVAAYAESQKQCGSGKATMRRSNNTCGNVVNPRPSRLGLASLNLVHVGWAEHQVREIHRCRLPGPHRAIEAVRLALRYANAKKGSQQATEYTHAEQELFLTCIKSQKETQAVQHVLRALEASPQAWNSFDPDASVASLSERLKFDSVLVVGAGTVGSSVALLLLQRGCRVILVETDAARRQTVASAIYALLDRDVAAGRMSAYKKRLMLRYFSLCGGVATEPLLAPAIAAVDCVIECITESTPEKRGIFVKLDGLCKRTCVFASCSSGTNIEELAACAPRHKQRCVGLHMYPPANENTFVEVVRCSFTLTSVLSDVVAWMDRLGKHCVVSHNEFGCVGTRVLLHGLIQAYALIQGGCFHHEVDKVLKKVVGFHFGIFEAEDIAGLDVTALTRKSMQARKMPNGLDSLMLPPQAALEAAEAIIRSGNLGRKTGEGWYVYQNNKNNCDSGGDSEGGETAKGAAKPRRVFFSIRGEQPQFNRPVELLCLRISREKGVVLRDISDEEVEDRIVLAMINEAARALEQGVVECAADVDAISVGGWGFPAWRGGLCYYADHGIGIERVVSRMRLYSKALGISVYPLPCETLLEMAEKKLTFASRFPSRKVMQ